MPRSSTYDPSHREQGSPFPAFRMSAVLEISNDLLRLDDLPAQLRLRDARNELSRLHRLSFHHLEIEHLSAGDRLHVEHAALAQQDAGAHDRRRDASHHRPDERGDDQRGERGERPPAAGIRDFHELVELLRAGQTSECGFPEELGRHEASAAGEDWQF